MTKRTNKNIKQNIEQEIAEIKISTPMQIINECYENNIISPGIMESYLRKGVINNEQMICLKMKEYTYQRLIKEYDIKIGIEKVVIDALMSKIENYK